MKITEKTTLIIAINMSIVSPFLARMRRGSLSFLVPPLFADP